MLRFNLYAVAFLQNDAAGMAQQVAWSAGKPGVEDVPLAFEADTAAYSGQLGKAREFSRRAVASAGRAEQKETAASHEADASLREALFGNAAEARQRADRIAEGRQLLPRVDQQGRHALHHQSGDWDGVTHWRIAGL